MKNHKRNYFPPKVSVISLSGQDVLTDSTDVLGYDIFSGDMNVEPY